MYYTKLKLRNAVKESLDHLPSGICFFDVNGMIVLCNLQMYHIFFAITGKDLQSRYDMDDLLSNSMCDKENLFRLPDNSMWQFKQTQVEGGDGKEYTQFIASDVTMLFRTNQELGKKNAMLQEEGIRIRKLADNMLELTRREEILHAKMRVHKQMGDGLAQVRHILQQGKPVDMEQIREWRSAVCMLQNDTIEQEEQEQFSVIQQMAESLGVHIDMYGILPCKLMNADIFLQAIRESVMNTVRHAQGDSVTVRVMEEEDRDVLVITNNGKMPEENIIESGGLASLREQVEKQEGTMQVEIEPAFQLRIELERGDAIY